MPFMVVLAVPLALFGALLALWLRGKQIDVYAQIGFVMLIGLAAKNSILIVEFAKRRREDGLDIVEAAMAAARLRLRPILMTAFAFILGVVPLMFATGAGAANSLHAIDEKSPLAGYDAERLEEGDARLFLSIERHAIMQSAPLSMTCAFKPPSRLYSERTTPKRSRSTIKGGRSPISRA